MKSTKVQNPRCIRRIQANNARLLATHRGAAVLPWSVLAATQARVTHQRSDTMYSRTVFPGVRTNAVRLLHTENVALLVVRLYTKSEELARLYHWFMPSKRSLSDVA